MAKDRSFAAKVAKAERPVNKCPACGQERVNMMLIKSVFKADKKSWKFQERTLAICKCNEKEIQA